MNLSEIEIKMLQLMSEGCSTKLMSQRTGISFNTMDTYRTRLLQKNESSKFVRRCSLCFKKQNNNLTYES